MSEFFGYFRDTSAASRKTMKLFCFHKDYRRVFVAKVFSPLALGVHYKVILKQNLQLKTDTRL